MYTQQAGETDQHKLNRCRQWNLRGWHECVVVDLAILDQGFNGDTAVGSANAHHVCTHCQKRAAEGVHALQAELGGIIEIPEDIASTQIGGVAIGAKTIGEINTAGRRKIIPADLRSYFADRVKIFPGILWR